jgi:HAD superfamily hydrolase (TIGR01509 family)
LTIASVIFDCDGVLVDSETTSNAVLAGVLTEIGLPTTPAESAVAFTGRSWPQCMEIVAERLGEPPPPELRERYVERLLAAYDAGLQAIPGVRDVLDASDLPRCVASNGGPRVVRHGLAATGLLDRFEPHALFSVADVGRGKPAPDLFLHAAGTMGWKPATTAVVEDTPLGVAAGVAAGMRVFGYAATTPADVLEAAGATPFASMDDLPGLLDGRS